MKSFSKSVKEELLDLVSQARHCQIVEVATILQFGDTLKAGKSGGLELVISAEQQQNIRKYFTLFKKTYNIIPDMVESEHGYELVISNQSEVESILQSVKIIQDGVLCMEKQVAPILLKNMCCKRVYLRRTYLQIGSMSAPEKGYHLEYVCTYKEQAEQIREVLHDFEIEGKITKRKKYWIVYVKDGSGIVELLNIMGAHVSLMNFENLRIVKEVRNLVNRRVNCEAANINRTVTAATKQITDIQKLISHKELETLPMNLQEMALVRMEYPDASLQELGSYLVPPVGKSGVNHRLRKLSERADELSDVVEGNEENYDSEIS